MSAIVNPRRRRGSHMAKKSVGGGRGVTHFTQVFLKIRPRILGVVSQYLRNSSDVEDVVQETFIRTYQAWIEDRVQQPEKYIFRTARNLSFKHLALHSTRLTDSIEDIGLPEDPGITDSVLRDVEGSERFALFCEATRSLPTMCRRVFILRRVYGLSHNEIAERLGIAVSTSNQHLAKALAMVTEYMREQGHLESVNDG